MGSVLHSVSVVWISKASTSQMYYFYGSFNLFLAACSLLRGSIMRGSTVIDIGIAAVACLSYVNTTFVFLPAMFTLPQ